ncbi:MAG: hypothetical protein GF309_10395 [Candidatus Lokiarchaeota archaeon]|nr:hypothetical protein [Candidatus Lokiarchaeota archaeon]
MSKYGYHYRIKKNARFDRSKVYSSALHPQLKRFTEVIWAGQDDEGFCVFKRDPHTGEVLRIDFDPP